MRRSICILSLLIGSSVVPLVAADLRIATFDVDATPPLGSPIAYTLAERIDDRLSARGVVLLSDEPPVVLCAVDWIGIANGGHDAWREALAEAAQTSVERVAVHTLHQHDAPRCDFSTEDLLAARGLGGKLLDRAFARRTIQRVADAARASIGKSRAVTHLGTGRARVERVASTRRILGPDGKVKHVRFSSCLDPEARAASEGEIDPWLRLIAFFDGERPITALTYYACHPQSYYRQGGVSADFVGLARARREHEMPDVLPVHFNGAGGDVAAGKYNDGSHAMRSVLTGRLAAAMRLAWERVERQPVQASDLEWRTEKVEFPLGETRDAATLLAVLEDASAAQAERIRAARELAYVRRVSSGHQFDIACLRLGDVHIVHTPGELFVGYQLAAQAMRPDSFVCFAAYGDYGPGYIGTEVAYSQGGYEVQPSSSRTAPAVEKVLRAALRVVLDVGTDSRSAAPRVEPIDWRPIFEGIDRVDLRLDVDRPLRGHALRVDLDAPGIEIVVTPSNGEKEGETDGRRTSSFLVEHRLQLAINAAPFRPIWREEGRPQNVDGLVVAGGEVVSPSEGKRPALVVMSEGGAHVVRPPVVLDGVRDAVAGFSVVLESGDVVGATGKRHPRTAAGVSRDGRRLYLLVIDGRQAGYSEGVTTGELGAWLKALGAEDGINLDGGGTTTMVLAADDGGFQLVNRPIHGGKPGEERVSASHFGLRARALR